MPEPADRNLLFGILALQMGFVNFDQIAAAMRAYALDNSKFVGDTLRNQGALTAAELQILAGLMEAQIKRYGDSTARKLASLLSATFTAAEVAVLPDEIGQRCLALMGANDATLPAGGRCQSQSLRPPILATLDVGSPSAIAGAATLPPNLAEHQSQRTSTYIEGTMAGGLPSIPGFEVLEKLGEGGMGVVFLARQIALNRLVALKMILSGSLARADEKVRFLAEAEAVAALRHPGVVQVYEFGTFDGRPYFALEYCSGGNLATKLAGTPLPATEAAVLLERLAGAVQAAHEQGIIHRDLKPANILLSADGAPKVTDFGLAKRVESGDHLTKTGAVVGTPSYMAPEQVNEAKSVGPLADVYALGAILYECLTGRPPFKAAKPLDTVMQVVSDEPVPIRRLNPAVSADLETICHKCLRKDPAHRYGSAAALAADLGRWKAGEPIMARQVGRPERAWRWCRRNRTLAGSLAAIATIVALGLVGLTAGLVVVTGLNGRLDAANAELLARNAELFGARQTALEQRDRALAARQRTREALDSMVSGVTEASLASQKTLSPEQKRFLESVIAYYQEFAAEPGEDRAGRERLATAHWRLADIRHRLGQRAAGVALLGQTAEILEKLVADFPKVPSYRRDLAQVNRNRGIILADLGNFAEAEAAYRAALVAQERVVADFPDAPGYRSDLASCHHNLGTLFDGLDRREEAVAEFRAALTMRDELAIKYPDEPENRRGLAHSHSSLGILFEKLRQPVAAEAEFRAAIAIKQQLASDFPDMPDYRSELARSHNSLGILLAGLRRRPEAEVEYRAALAIREQLVTAFPAVPDYRVELGGANVNLGNLLLDQGDAAAAVERYGKGIGWLGPIVSAEPRLRHAREFLRNAYWGRARAYVKLKHFAEALPDWASAQEFHAGPTGSYFQVQRAGCLARLGRAAEAVEEAEKSVADTTATAAVYYDSACAVSLSSAAANNSAANMHAPRAVELLRLAITKGFDNIRSLLVDPDLTPLRGRADYADLLWDIADTPAAPMKP